MDEMRVTSRDEALLAAVALSRERREAIEELIIHAEQTITRARLAVAGCRRVWALIEARRAGMLTFSPTRSAWFPGSVERPWIIPGVDPHQDDLGPTHDVIGPIDDEMVES